MKISGLLRWGSAKTLSTSPVATYADLSGNGNDGIASGGDRPTLDATGINGNKAIRFTSPAFQFLTLPNFLTGTSGWAGVVAKHVGDPPASGDEGAFWGNTAVAPAIGGWGTSAAYSHEPFSDGIIYEGFGSTARKVCGNPTPALTTAFVYTVVSAPSDFRFYVNGTLLFSTATNTVGWSTVPALGSAAGFATNGWLGEDFFATGTPTASDLSAWHSYTATQWNILVAQ